MNFYDMKLGDSFWYSGISCQVVRVPGGWLFQSADTLRNIIPSMSFVPFNNEFMENSAPSELAATTANSDYATALKVLDEWMGLNAPLNIYSFRGWLHDMQRLHSSTNVA